MSSTVTEKPSRPAYTTKWMFHRPDFIRTMDDTSIRSFYQYSENKVLAVLRCLIKDSSAYSAPEGLYGCMELEEEADPVKFLEYVRGELSAAGINKLSVTLYPEEYDRLSWHRQRQALEHCGFKLEGSISNRLIAVTEEENEQLASNDWRENAPHLAEFSVTQEPLDQYQNIDRLVRRAELKEGSNGSDTLITSCIAKFPEETLLFAVREGVKFCGTGVFLKAGPGILYTLHLAMLDEYASRAPLHALFQKTYEWAELRELRYIDLGQIGLGLQENIGMVAGTGERWVSTW